MPIQRRGLLRGIGAGLTLPFLESLPLWAGEPVDGPVDAEGAPRRLAFVFFGNGVWPADWGATTAKDGRMHLRRSLLPLAPLSDEILVMQGLTNPLGQGTGSGHSSKMNFLSGVKTNKSLSDLRHGITVDQLLARELGAATPLPSLVMGTESPNAGNDTGYSMVYSSYMSWNTASTPAPKEIYPRIAFDRLFDDGSQLRRDRSVVDAVHGDAKDLIRHLNRSDRRKLDEFLGSLQEVERRIDRAAQQSPEPPKWMTTLSDKELAARRPASGLPEDPAEHHRLMLDIMVLALQMDRTRIVSLMLSNDFSKTDFGFLPGVKGESHALSHHRGDKAKCRMYQQVNEYMVRIWSEALQKMRAIDEGGRSLLDNSMVILLSQLMDGNTHDGGQLPLILAGRGGGTIKPGRVITLSRKSKHNRMCNLHLALMERMGIRLDRFGDADAALSELA